MHRDAAEKMVDAEDLVLVDAESDGLEQTVPSACPILVALMDPVADLGSADVNLDGLGISAMRNLPSVMIIRTSAKIMRLASV